MRGGGSVGIAVGLAVGLGVGLGGGLAVGLGVGLAIGLGVGSLIISGTVGLGVGLDVGLGVGSLIIIGTVGLGVGSLLVIDTVGLGGGIDVGLCVGLGVGILIVSDTIAGLPGTVRPVAGSMALTITLVVNDEPAGTPVASTFTSILVLVPAARFVPALCESETKRGACLARAAVQFNVPPPVLLMLICWDPAAVVVKERSGPAVSPGGDPTFNVTPTVCGLPVIVVAPFTAANDIEPRYIPAASAADVTVTVKVALPPPTTVAEAGVTASQPVPDDSVKVGVIVTLPAQVPLTPTSKVCVAGFVPPSVEKVSPATEGPCRLHADR